MDTDTPLCILCLDGGGFGGISALYVLKNIMHKLNESQPSIERPCQVFDLICGSGAGGLIALMLGRLEMTVNEAIQNFQRFSENVFTSTNNYGGVTKFDHQILEEQIKNIIRFSDPEGDPDSMPLRASSDVGCKTFVVTTKARSSALLRTYSTHDPPLVLWQAARATMTSPPLFEPLIIEGITYGDGGDDCHNPAGRALREAPAVMPNRTIGCVLSLGDGDRTEGVLEAAKRTLLSSVLMRSFMSPVTTFHFTVLRYCTEVWEECQKTHRWVQANSKTFGISDKYFRLTLSEGSVLDDWRSVPVMSEKSRNEQEAVAIVINAMHPLGASCSRLRLTLGKKNRRATATDRTSSTESSKVVGETRDCSLYSPSAVHDSGEQSVFQNAYLILERAFRTWQTPEDASTGEEGRAVTLDGDILEDVVFGKVPNSNGSLWRGALTFVVGDQPVQKLLVEQSGDPIYGIPIGYINDFQCHGAELWFGKDSKVYYRPFHDVEPGVMENGWMLYKVMGGYDMRNFGKETTLNPALSKN